MKARKNDSLVNTTETQGVSRGFIIFMVIIALGLLTMVAKMAGIF